jgi:type IV pilus assembly protein PilA
MKNLQKGFTLIELMIVVAIIAILAAIAIPAYQNYLIRSQVSEGAVLTDGAKTAISEYYSNHGSFPTTNTMAGLAKAGSITGKYVSSVDVGAATTGGTIVATFSNTSPYSANSAINTKEFVLSAITSAGSISWTCDKSTVDTKYLPSSCR